MSAASPREKGVAHQSAVPIAVAHTIPPARVVRMARKIETYTGITTLNSPYHSIQIREY